MYDYSGVARSTNGESSFGLYFPLFPSIIPSVTFVITYQNTLILIKIKKNPIHWIFNLFSLVS